MLKRAQAETHQDPEHVGGGRLHRVSSLGPAMFIALGGSAFAASGLIRAGDIAHRRCDKPGRSGPAP